jgi:hypothetical protein
MMMMMIMIIIDYDDDDILTLSIYTVHLIGANISPFELNAAVDDILVNFFSNFPTTSTDLINSASGNNRIINDVESLIHFCNNHRQSSASSLSSSGHHCKQLSQSTVQFIHNYVIPPATINGELSSHRASNTISNTSSPGDRDDDSCDNDSDDHGDDLGDDVNKKKKHL